MIITRSKAKTITIISLLFLSGYFIFRLLMPFLVPILWAILLTVFVWPLRRYLAAKIESKNLAAALAVIITLGVLIVPLLLLAIQLGHELNQVYHQARDGHQLNQVSEWLQSDRLQESKFSIWLQQHLGVSMISLRDKVVGYLDKFASGAVGYITSLISNTLFLLGNLFFITFTLFFLLRDGDRLLGWWLRLLPMASERKHLLMKNLHNVIQATLIGSFLVAGAQGGLAGLMFYFLGVPGALLWTMVMCTCSLIPMLGSAIIWAPAAIWLLATGHIVKGIILIAWGGGVVGLVDNFMRPVLMRRQTNIHTAAGFYAILGGINAFGFIGLILGPIAVVTFLTLIEFVRPSTVDVTATVETTG